MVLKGKEGEAAGRVVQGLAREVCRAYSLADSETG